MFEKFSPVSKATWAAQIEKDLKGKPYAELIWQLNNDLHLEPFYTKAEIGQSAPLARRSGNNWQVAELIVADDCKKANTAALEGLLGGADALEITINKALSAADFTALFEKIELPFISIHFKLRNSDLQLMQTSLQLLAELVKSRGYNLHEINGSFYCAITDKPENWLKIKELIGWSKTALPAFKLLVIEQQNHKDSEEKLLQSIRQSVLTIDRLSDLGLSLQNIHENICFSVLTGKQYFVEIANIRALKLLWLHVQKAYGIVGLDAPPVHATFDALAYDNDQNTNMIRATTMALSAAIGGVDCLTVMPADEKGETAFLRRIARNVQHLLKMESYINRVSDPAAGAYYIEKLTNEIAARSWEKFTSTQA